MEYDRKIFKTAYRISYDLRNVPSGKSKHFSFIFRRNNVVSVGWNTHSSTHPTAKLCGYRYDDVHSELSAVLRYSGDMDSLKRCILVNTRINRFGHLRPSKPCIKCMKWIPLLGFKEIWYTDVDNKFHLLENYNIDSSKHPVIPAIF